jgi:DNA polymerase-3 subunit beta
LLTEKFPPYGRIIARTIPTANVHVDRKALMDLLTPALTLARMKDQNPTVHCATIHNGDDLGNRFKVETSNDSGSYCEDIPCEAANAEIRIAVNPQYLIDVAKVLDSEQVTIGWMSEAEPYTVSCSGDPGFMYLCMPIRIN